MEELQHREGPVKGIVPVDAIRAFHNAFREEMKVIDAAAHAAAGGSGSLDLVLQRRPFFNEALAWHDSGEEQFVFPAIETAAPLVAEAYVRDHRGIDALNESLNQAISASDTLSIARATATLNFHLSIHLAKEEEHLYRIFNDRVSLRNQWDIVRKMSQRIPSNRFPELVSWLYLRIGLNDRENMTRIWRQASPGLAFTRLTQLIREAIGNDWEELTGRIPELK